MVPIGFEARSINLEYKLNQVYLISIFDQLEENNNDMIIIDIGYRKMKLEKGNLTMRFQNLASILNGSQETRDALLPLMIKNELYSGVVDPLHSINLLNICAKFELIDLMKLLLEKYQDIPYLSDANM